MTGLENNKWLDDVLFDAIGREKSQVDFEKWHQKHPKAVEMLTSRAGRRPSDGGRPDRIWRTIMKSRIRKVAVAVIILAAVVALINQFGGSGRATSVVWADIAQNIKSAKSLSWKTTSISKTEQAGVIYGRLLEPGRMRFELPDGSVWIFDYQQRKVLILDPAKRTFSIESTTQGYRDTYNTFRKFQDIPGFSASQIGQRQIDGKQAVGFRLTKDNTDSEMTVWADVETRLPIRIEEAVRNAQGPTRKYITTDIVFDSELDESLFSLDSPEGYEQRKPVGVVERQAELVRRLKNQEKESP
ncbi:MAG: LolA family protein [Planctomycetota bacterium]|jgi:outer membrane lipoprotein-sorting protein